MNDAPRIQGVFIRDWRPTNDWSRIPPRTDENGTPIDKIPREFSDNRIRYIAQSAATKRGIVPRLPSAREACG